MLKWRSCKWSKGSEKGDFRATHTRTPFFKECPPWWPPSFFVMCISSCTRTFVRWFKSIYAGLFVINNMLVLLFISSVANGEMQSYLKRVPFQAGLVYSPFCYKISIVMCTRDDISYSICCLLLTKWLIYPVVENNLRCFFDCFPENQRSYFREYLDVFTVCQETFNWYKVSNPISHFDL